MLSTMPFLSSVWNVKAVSAGIFARKLVSGLPSGSVGWPCWSPGFSRSSLSGRDGPGQKTRPHGSGQAGGSAVLTDADDGVVALDAVALQAVEGRLLQRALRQT